MERDDFALQLRSWRRANRVKQASLALDLGVTQAAISRWECGLDLPTQANMEYLRRIMRVHSEKYVAELTYIERTIAIRALFKFDNIGLVVSSRGLKQIWPGFSQMQGQAFRDCLVDESAELFNNPETAYLLNQGVFLVATGVSDRHIEIDVDAPIRHRWHCCLRQIDGLKLIDVSFEPCSIDTPTGIEEVIKLGTLVTR